MSTVTLKTLKMLVISDDNGNSEYHSIISIISKFLAQDNDFPAF